MSYAVEKKSNEFLNNQDALPVEGQWLQEELLDLINVQINGKRPWDIQVNDDRLYARIYRDGSLGLAEAYMEGWWDCEKLDVLFTKAIGANLSENLVGLVRIKIALISVAHKIFNFQTVKRAFQVGEQHYDIGNNLYQCMLDPYMIYSCGYWRDADNLAQAQINKLDLICRKLKLKPNMTLLDIGCGWGGLAKYAAENYGVKVTGITVSKEQQKLAKEAVNGLDVEILLKDYRSLQGAFDRIVSVGMFEHVGRKNYQTYFSTVKRLLRPDGLFLLHTIGEENLTPPDPFISRYIFPNGNVPCRPHIQKHSSGLLRLEDWHNFGPDYDTTLMAWAKNFEKEWANIKADYDEKFYRMWRYYLYSCAGYFRSREGQLWQLVLSHPDRKRGYGSVR